MDWPPRTSVLLKQCGIFFVPDTPSKFINFLQFNCYLLISVVCFFETLLAHISAKCKRVCETTVEDKGQRETRNVAFWTLSQGMFVLLHNRDVNNPTCLSSVLSAPLSFTLHHIPMSFMSACCLFV